MKREIKFRAWYEGKMYEVFEINISGSTVAISLPRFPFIQDVIPDELMQYTGLKDKNGNEIYEGDVIRHEFEGEYGPYEHRDTVEYHEGAFYPICEKPGNEFEVIGNIYENPELLK